MKFGLEQLVVLESGEVPFPEDLMFRADLVLCVDPAHWIQKTGASADELWRAHHMHAAGSLVFRQMDLARSLQ